MSSRFPDNEPFPSSCPPPTLGEFHQMQLNNFPKASRFSRESDHSALDTYNPYTQPLSHFSPFNNIGGNYYHSFDSSQFSQNNTPNGIKMSTDHDPNNGSTNQTERLLDETGAPIRDLPVTLDMFMKNARFGRQRSSKPGKATDLHQSIPGDDVENEATDSPSKIEKDSLSLYNKIEAETRPTFGSPSSFPPSSTFTSAAPSHLFAHPVPSSSSTFARNIVLVEQPTFQEASNACNEALFGLPNDPCQNNGNIRYGLHSQGDISVLQWNFDEFRWIYLARIASENVTDFRMSISDTGIEAQYCLLTGQKLDHGHVLAMGSSFLDQGSPIIQQIQEALRAGDTINLPPLAKNIISYQKSKFAVEVPSPQTRPANRTLLAPFRPVPTTTSNTPHIPYTSPYRSARGPPIELKYDSSMVFQPNPIVTRPELGRLSDKSKSVGRWTTRPEADSSYISPTKFQNSLRLRDASTSVSERENRKELQNKHTTTDRMLQASNMDVQGLGLTHVAQMSAPGSQDQKNSYTPGSSGEMLAKFRTQAKTDDLARQRNERQGPVDRTNAFTSAVGSGRYHSLSSPTTSRTLHKLPFSHTRNGMTKPRTVMHDPFRMDTCEALTGSRSDSMTCMSFPSASATVSERNGVSSIRPWNETNTSPMVSRRPNMATSSSGTPPKQPGPYTAGVTTLPNQKNHNTGSAEVDKQLARFNSICNENLVAKYGKISNGKLAAVGSTPKTSDQDPSSSQDAFMDPATGNRGVRALETRNGPAYHAELDKFWDSTKTGHHFNQAGTAYGLGRKDAYSSEATSEACQRLFLPALQRLSTYANHTYSSELCAGNTFVGKDKGGEDNSRSKLTIGRAKGNSRFFGKPFATPEASLIDESMTEKTSLNGGSVSLFGDAKDVKIGVNFVRPKTGFLRILHPSEIPDDCFLDSDEHISDGKQESNGYDSYDISSSDQDGKEGEGGEYFYGNGDYHE